MVTQDKIVPLSLMEQVKALENKTSLGRGQQVLDTLQALGIKATVQEFHIPKIRNILVDFLPNSEEKKLLFSAHYDVVRGSPGANDNASGVSVLLGLCHKLKSVRAPVRILFFDREEAWLRTPIFRLGLLGSLYYVLRTNVRNITAVYNLEFCGLGDCLGIWPVRSRETGYPVFKRVTAAATRLGLSFKSSHIPWVFFSSDHLSFRLRGFANAVTLSLLPVDRISSLEKSIAELRKVGFFTRRSGKLPDPLRFIHTPEDKASRLSETSLRLMLSLLMEVIQEFAVSTNSPANK